MKRLPLLHKDINIKENKFILIVLRNFFKLLVEYKLLATK